jgi:hypothetical protein
MMNAELAAAEQVHVLIPIRLPLKLHAGLRALSGHAWPEPIIKTLTFAQRYVAAAVPWDDMRAAITVLTRTNVFVRPEDGDEKGIRIRIPDAADAAPISE